MSRAGVEVMILTINAIGAGILIFVARVLQPIMNDMDPLAFKQFLARLNRHALRDAMAVTIATLPVVAGAIYLLWFGFGHWWFTSGLAMWLIGSSISKIVNLPIYRWAGGPAPADSDDVVHRRRRLQAGNSARAWLTLLSVLLMACQFGLREVSAAVAGSILLSLPLAALARRSTLK